VRRVRTRILLVLPLHLLCQYTFFKLFTSFLLSPQGKALVTAAGLHSPEARKLFMKAQHPQHATLLLTRMRVDVAHFPFP